MGPSGEPQETARNPIRTPWGAQGNPGDTREPHRTPREPQRAQRTPKKEEVADNAGPVQHRLTMKPLGPFKGVIGIGIAPLQGAIRVPRGGLGEPRGTHGKHEACEAIEVCGAGKREKSERGQSYEPPCMVGTLGLPSDRKIKPRNTRDRLEIKDSKNHKTITGATAWKYVLKQ